MLITDRLENAVTRVTWPNGLRLIMESVPGARTSAIGLWFNTGSRDETPALQGVAHFLEHMFFKGTHTLDAQRLALEHNALGSHFNAFTTQETVCLHTRVIDEHLERATRLLVEMYRHSALAPAEVERERSVILEEIKMITDSPEDWLNDLFYENLWGAHGLGRAIIGTPETIASLTREDVARHLSAQFTAPRLVVAVAGAVDPAAFPGFINTLLGDLPSVNGRAVVDPPPAPLFRSQHVERPLEQTNFMLGTLAPDRTSDDRHAFALLNSVLGGGPSSRIFQEIRERRGLAYSIGTFAAPHRDTGCFGISGATSPEHLAQVLDLSRAEMESICREPVPVDELANAKDQWRAHLLLSLESMNQRMSRLGEIELNFDRYIPLEETLAKIEAVTADDVLATAQRYLRGSTLSTVTLGPLEVDPSD